MDCPTFPILCLARSRSLIRDFQSTLYLSLESGYVPNSYGVSRSQFRCQGKTKFLEIRTLGPNNKGGGRENRIELADAYILYRFALEVKTIKIIILMVRKQRENK